MDEIFTMHKTAFVFLIIAAVLVCLTLLVFVFFAARRYFASCDITGKRKKVLTALSVVTVFLVLFTAVFGPFLYEILYKAAAAKPDANLKNTLPSAISGTMYFALSMLFVISILIVVINIARRPRETFFTAKTVTRLAVFSALSIVLYFAKFNLPAIFPGFLEIHISDMPALLAGFMMGPQAGAVVIIVRAFIKLPFTTTGGVGELGDLILGLVFVLSSSFVYRKLRTRKGAIIALAVGAVCCTAAAVVVNRFILIPFFATLYSWNTVIGMVSSLYKDVTKESFYTYFMLLATLPFNMLRCILSCVVAFLLYKPTKMAFGFVEKKTMKKKPETALESKEQE